MRTDEYGIIQPNDDKLLFRYMDKWKFDSLCTCKFVFTNAKNQSDELDCFNYYKETGYTLRANHMRVYTLLSCWTLDNEFSKEKVLQYCNFKNKDGTQESQLAYVIKTSYSKLESFLKMKCRNNRHYRYNGLSWVLRKGNVEYIDVSLIKNTPLNRVDNSCFIKRNLPELKAENEFRIIAELGASFNKYDEKEKAFIPQNVTPEEIMVMQGNPRDFLIDVYEYNKVSDEFKQIGIPSVSCQTITTTLFTPSKI